MDKVLQCLALDKHNDLIYPSSSILDTTKQGASGYLKLNFLESSTHGFDSKWLFKAGIE